ncbi:E3 ubiquitin-protein ligase IPI1-like isoform X1 [Oryza glaberrima]|uniref:RING-type domain-containing protein n=1 Tax=Oryza glaberrima TaxID=4538 RepID=I1QLE6_ORYGL|nr:E3 ubiquitin-protein ligase IPI1-like isoform X1 [Oryza glaberrima]
MDLERSPPPPPPEGGGGGGGGGGGASCSICLDPVVAGGRSVARLQCGHEFHLDCIGSAFNAKGAMQCPNCRKIEKGRWLYASGHHPSPDIDIGGWVTGETYDITSDIPFGFQWCPFSGFTQLASVFEEGEAEQTSYHTVGDHSNAASSSLVCPYLALRGFLHPVHVPSSSSSGAESSSFHRHPTSLEGHAAHDLSNTQVFHATESRNHDNDHRYMSNLPVSGIPDHSVAPFGIGLPRYDSSSQQRTRPYAHHRPLVHRPTPRNGSNMVTPLGSVPAVMAETRGHGHGARGHMYQQSMHSLQSSPFPPTSRRARPRALTITSFIAASSSAEIGGHHGFAPPVNRSNSSDGEAVSRPVDRPYGWGQEGFTPFPWIPADGESHWWGTFNPMQNHTHGGFTRRPTGERMPQSHPDSGYHSMHPQRMPPFL